GQEYCEYRYTGLLTTPQNVMVLVENLVPKSEFEGFSWVAPNNETRDDEVFASDESRVSDMEIIVAFETNDEFNNTVKGILLDNDFRDTSSDTLETIPEEDEEAVEKYRIKMS
ncbi:hypothetical protein H4R24_004806, partial [Coemansia sp. RSA 988]